MNESHIVSQMEQSRLSVHHSRGTYLSVWQIDTGVA